MEASIRISTTNTSRVVASDLHIYRSAGVLIDQQGEDVLIHAAMRIDELLDKDNPDRRAVWVRILKVVEELLSFLERLKPTADKDHHRYHKGQSGQSSQS